MSTASTVPVTLADRLPGAVVRDALLVMGFALAIAVGARLRVPLPFTPVPVTAQTLVVLAGAGALGARRAGTGAALYAVVGLLGVPWFAVSSGATLGYVAGFVVAGVLVGAAADQGRLVRLGPSLATMALATASIYVLGAGVLALVLDVGPGRALALGVVPFLVGDAVKVALAALAIPTLEGIVRRGTS